jgi:hypothetical protein
METFYFIIVVSEPMFDNGIKISSMVVLRGAKLRDDSSTKGKGNHR